MVEIFCSRFINNVTHFTCSVLPFRSQPLTRRFLFARPCFGCLHALPWILTSCVYIFSKTKACFACAIFYVVYQNGVSHSTASWGMSLSMSVGQQCTLQTKQYIPLFRGQFAHVLTSHTVYSSSILWSKCS